MLRSADAVIVHNGKVDSRHERLLSGKAIVTLAHNYMWNVDRRFERLGMPSLVVGQYQATLPEFAGWTAVPNPLPIWEPAYMHGEKPDVVTICYTPSGRHERYPQGHRLYWHGKGYETTMRVLERMSKVMPLRLEVIGERQLSHADALAMKRRAHIVIDECVTGSYHRNSLEGLATGCVVVNGVGILPGVAEVLRGCAPGMDRTPFVFSTLDTLEAVLTELVNRGPDVLAAAGHENRAWMEQHWNFADQWARWWEPAIEAAMAKASPIRRNPEPVRRVQIEQPKESISPVLHGISVVIPHGGSERLPLLASTLATLRQRSGIGEVIVVEMGRTPVAAGLADRWADSHLFIEHDGAFERARALNAGSAVARGDIIFWLDNDLLVPSTLLAEAVKELQHRRLDYLTPYSSVRYLSEQDSAAVMRGERDPQDCQPVNTFRTGRRGVLSFGGMGLVRREFLQRWGGLIEGFRGWGGEDNAWNRKVSLLGRGAATSRMDLHVHHLYHRSSGGYLMAAASSENPHYPENLALLRRVFAVRDRNEFARQFPAAAQAPAVVTSASRRTAGSHEDGPPVWTYWEGPCPAWIRACRRTITAHAPRVRILDPERFDRLWDRDRDVDLSRLHAPHRADFIRAFLVQRYGGLWIDADCLVMQPLEPLLDSLTEYDFIGHRERVGLISNAFIAARQGSRIAGAFYERVRQILKSRKSLYWNALGADPLSAIVASDATGWHELPCESVQPICWSRPGDFFVERDEAGHDREFNAQALCYMLSNGAINNYTASHHPPDLLSERTFFRYLLTRAIGKAGQDTSAAYESQFGAHVEIYRRQKIESLSGPGSCLAQTRELRERLPLLVESLGITSLVDAPCGDFNWMQHVALGPVDYTGVDVLGEIIADNQWRHASSRRRFIRANVVTDPLPRADAVLCRDLLVHLSYDDIKRTIRNFRSSGATYLLMTTFTKPRPNQDTSGGEWRPLNFLAPPFEFPPPVRLVNEKCTEAGDAFDDKSLGVWQLADLAI